MGTITRPQPVKLIVGFIYKEETALKKAKKILISHFKDIDFESQPLPFEYTNYYKKEIGSNLKRQFISFKKLISPGELSKIKLLTNKIERKLSTGRPKQRSINIDPGYLDLAKLVLATTKDFMHRIYLKKGIFAEVTLVYQNNTFRHWDWTYPDYRTKEYIAIFNQIRALYDKQIK